MTCDASIVPILGYRNVSAASQWLCNAFGFELSQIEVEPDGDVRFASLRLGTAHVLISPAADASQAHLFVQPDDVHGANTQTCYITIENLDDHCARAAAAGATIEFEPQFDRAGRRFYVCRDLEGHLWTFGTGIGTAVKPDGGLATPTARPWSYRPVLVLGLAQGIVVALVAFASLPTLQAHVGLWLAKANAFQSAVSTTGLEHGQHASLSVATKDEATLLAAEQARVADLLENMRNLNAQLARLDQSRREATDARHALGDRLQHLLSLYDQAKQDAERAQQQASAADKEKLQALSNAGALAASAKNATEVLSQLQRAKEEAEQARQRATAAENDRVQALSSLEAERAQARDAAKALSQLQQASDRAGQTKDATVAMLTTQRTQLSADRIEIEAINRQLTDERELGILLQRRIDQMTAAIGALQAQKTTAEQSAQLLRGQLARALEAFDFEHTQLKDARGALLTMQAQLDYLHLTSSKVLQPTGAKQTANARMQLATNGSLAEVDLANSYDASVTNLAGSTQLEQAGARTAKLKTKWAGERAKCVGHLIQGKVDWGGGKNWNRNYASSLCASTRDAQKTLNCFTNQVGLGESWQTAIMQCKDG